MVDPCRDDEGGEAMDYWVRSTLLVRRWERMKHEILLHKWYESEKAGHDIGWERASVDWMIHYGSSRRTPPHEA